MKLHLYVDQARLVRDALYNRRDVIKHSEDPEAAEGESQELERLILFLNQEIQKETE